MDHRSVHQAARALRKQENIDLRNFLFSIREDAEFVRRVHQEYPRFPLWANLRNGLWLAPKFSGAACVT
jgi:hypothetical protein